MAGDKAIAAHHLREVEDLPTVHLLPIKIHFHTAYIYTRSRVRGIPLDGEGFTGQVVGLQTRKSDYRRRPVVLEDDVPRIHIAGHVRAQAVDYVMIAVLMYIPGEWILTRRGGAVI